MATPLTLFALSLITSIDSAEDIYCDVVIGGGNTAAMSAAITAAQSAQHPTWEIPFSQISRFPFFSAETSYFPFYVPISRFQS